MSALSFNMTPDFGTISLVSSRISDSVILRDFAISSMDAPLAKKFLAASTELYPLSRTHKKKGLKNPKKIFKYQLDFLSLEDRYQ